MSAPQFIKAFNYRDPGGLFGPTYVSVAHIIKVDVLDDEKALLWLTGEEDSREPRRVFTYWSELKQLGIDWGQ